MEMIENISLLISTVIGEFFCFTYSPFYQLPIRALANFQIISNNKIKSQSILIIDWLWLKINYRPQVVNKYMCCFVSTNYGFNGTEKQSYIIIFNV